MSALAIMHSLRASLGTVAACSLVRPLKSLPSAHSNEFMCGPEGASSEILELHSLTGIREDAFNNYAFKEYDQCSESNSPSMGTQPHQSKR